MLKISKKFSTFIVVGAVAAAVNFVSRIILNLWFSFEYSVVISYFLGLITCYVLSRKFVFFETDSSIISSSIRFVFVNIVAIIQTYYVSIYLYLLLDKYTDWSYSREIAHFCGICVPVITSYYGHKYFSFRK
jgi:putative flippase GtrA